MKTMKVNNYTDLDDLLFIIPNLIVMNINKDGRKYYLYLITPTGDYNISLPKPIAEELSESIAGVELFLRKHMMYEYIIKKVRAEKITRLLNED